MRTRVLFCLATAATFLASAHAHAAIIWSSAAAHPDEVRVYAPDVSHDTPWYDGTSASPIIKIGTWNQPDFTTDASTTVHVWARWNEKISPVLDILIAATDPATNPYDVQENILQHPPGDIYRLNVQATSSLQEYVIPTIPGKTFSAGDAINLWTFFYPSWSAYGANHWIGASGAVPYVEICEGPCEESPPPPSDPCANGGCVSNVLFLPGIEGSRLYEGVNCGKAAEEKLWEPIGESLWKILRGAGDAKVKDLYLNRSGESACGDIYAKADDIIDSAGGDIYKSFIAEMDGLKASGAIVDWEAAAYDWRLSLDDLLHNGAERNGKIYYGEATGTPYIEQTLRNLASNSRTGKVIIVAHSNGGLVAKALLNRLGGAAATSLVDKVVMVGAPQSGAPVDLGALLYGYGQGISSWGIPILHSNVARALAQNLPMAYHLLPSEDYLESTAGDAAHPVIRFSGAGYAKEKAAYGATIANRSSLDDFLLAKEGGRGKPPASDVNSAEILNAPLIEYANAQHAALDSWAPPAGIEVDQIAGWGADTVAGIDFYTLPRLLSALTFAGPVRAYRPIFVEDGDGTVPVPSALQIASGANVKRYWVDLFTYNYNSHTNRTHRDLFEIPSVRDFIEHLIKNSTSTLPIYISENQPVPQDVTKKLIFFLHTLPVIEASTAPEVESPPVAVTLKVKHSSGKVTGVAEDNSVTEDIPDSVYNEFGSVPYIIVPKGAPYEVIVRGQASSDSGGVGGASGRALFTLEVQEISGGVIIASTTIANVPVTASTTATLAISPGGVGASMPFTVDENGDGEVEITITPVAGDVVNYEPPPQAELISDAVVEPIVKPEPAPTVVGGGAGGDPIPMVITFALNTVATTTATTTSALATTTQEIATIAAATTTPHIFVNIIPRLAVVARRLPKRAPISPSPRVAAKPVPDLSKTASVYGASQQSFLKKIGAGVYNGLHGFWTVLKKLF